jgi:hypothetical protein
MPVKKRFVNREVFIGLNPLAGLDENDPIDQQKWVAVR